MVSQRGVSGRLAMSRCTSTRVKSSGMTVEVWPAAGLVPSVVAMWRPAAIAWCPMWRAGASDSPSSPVVLSAAAVALSANASAPSSTGALPLPIQPPRALSSVSVAGAAGGADAAGSGPPLSAVMMLAMKRELVTTAAQVRASRRAPHTPSESEERGISRRWTKRVRKRVARTRMRPRAKASSGSVGETAAKQVTKPKWTAKRAMSASKPSWWSAGRSSASASTARTSTESSASSRGRMPSSILEAVRSAAGSSTLDAQREARRRRRAARRLERLVMPLA
mmetsp:Transcript_17025/g.44851  ORF Transcript_17025/g.44851 Transcript_17025/m.44851 type:complete len:280 (-) Transcript_17025:711-1550(-)